MMRRIESGEIERVATYSRVSSAEQVKGHSLDTQRAELQGWATSNSWRVVRDFEDAGVTGTSVRDRHGFLEMIALGMDGGYDAVLVSRIDRFARSRRDAAVYKELLADHGVRVLSRNEPTVGDGTSAGFLTEGMLDVMAEHYSVQLSENVSSGKATRARKGLPLGDIPFGYRSVSPQLPPEIVPGEGDAVRCRFEEYAAGNRSMLALADSLNTAGFRPRSKQGLTTFSKASISGMLSNPFYVGDITYHGEVICKGLHEPIVKRELWDQVQRVREERARKPQVFAARPRRPYLLAGIGVCAGCGSPIWANTTGYGRNSYYRCASRSRGGNCAQGSCRSERPESEIDALFGRLELPELWRERVAELSEEASMKGEVEAERRKLQEKIRRIQQGLVDGVLDNESANRAIRDARAVLVSLPAEDSGEMQVRE